MHRNGLMRGRRRDDGDAMASNPTQSFIVSGALDTFDREIDLTHPDAHDKITKLAKKFRTLFAEMHERVDELAARTDQSAS